MIEVYTTNGLLSINWLIKNENQVDWCRENCSDFFDFDLLSLTTRWNFVSEIDAMAFKLRWT